MKPERLLPILSWGPRYDRSDLRSDLGAGITVGAMLVPQAMAYALLAGLPPAVGLYAATIPVLVYAVFGTSRQLAVGPVAIVSLLTASALGPLVEEGTAGYLNAAAMLALMVGIVHLVLGAGRLGYLVNFLSHSVLVGFTAAAALIIGFSQAKHILGISVERTDHFYETVLEVVDNAARRRIARPWSSASPLSPPSSVSRGCCPASPPPSWSWSVPSWRSNCCPSRIEASKWSATSPTRCPHSASPISAGRWSSSLVGTALVITLVGFMESIAVAKVYARRHRYEVEPNAELVGLGAANVAAGLFGGYPVTGGFSRTAVNDTAGARTPLASIITAGIVLATIAFLTPLLFSLPNAALGAIIIMAVIGLIDVG